MIKVQASVSKGWLHKYGGFIFDSQYYLDPYYRMKQDEACHAFIKSRFPGYPVYNMEDNLVPDYPSQPISPGNHRMAIGMYPIRQ